MIHALAVFLLAVQAGRPTPLPLGSPAPAFTLPGVDGKDHSLKDFADSRLLVIIFNTNHCPTAQLYEGRIKRLHEDYRDRGVALVVINPNDAKAVRPDELGYTDLGDSLEEMKIRAKHLGFAFPYLYDGEDQEISKLYGPLVTPHAFLFDKTRRLRYHGRIDDNEYEDEGIKARELRDGIEALLAGKEVGTATTRPRGCSVKWGYKRPLVAKWLEKAEAENVVLDVADEKILKALAGKESENVRLVHILPRGNKPRLGEFVMLHWMYRKRNFELVVVMGGDEKQKDGLGLILKSFHASNRNLLVDDVARLTPLAGETWEGRNPMTLLRAPGGKVLYRKEGDVDMLAIKRAIVANLRDDRLKRFRKRRKK